MDEVAVLVQLCHLLYRQIRQQSYRFGKRRPAPKRFQGVLFRFAHSHRCVTPIC